MEEGDITTGTITELSYLHTDHLGSVVAATDEAGLSVWRNDYTPFGEQAVKDESKYALFTSKQMDHETELYYFNARWYDPEIGRFISEDPIRDSKNWYVYCRNNPLIMTDPWGLYGSVGAAAAAAAGAVGAAGAQAGAGGNGYGSPGHAESRGALSGNGNGNSNGPGGLANMAQEAKTEAGLNKGKNHRNHSDHDGIDLSDSLSDHIDSFISPPDYADDAVKAAKQNIADYGLNPATNTLNLGVENYGEDSPGVNEGFKSALTEAINSLKSKTNSTQVDGSPVPNTYDADHGMPSQVLGGYVGGGVAPSYTGVSGHRGGDAGCGGSQFGGGTSATAAYGN